MISATQLRPGMVIKWNKDLFSIFKMEHRTPGNLRGFVQVKMRNFKSGTMVEHRFSSEDKVERAALEEDANARCLEFGGDFRDDGDTSFRGLGLREDPDDDGHADLSQTVEFCGTLNYGIRVDYLKSL